MYAYWREKVTNQHLFQMSISEVPRTAEHHKIYRIQDKMFLLEQPL